MLLEYGLAAAELSLITSATYAEQADPSPARRRETDAAQRKLLRPE
jgi:hypothetical protein